MTPQAVLMPVGAWPGPRHVLSPTAPAPAVVCPGSSSRGCVADAMDRPNARRRRTQQGLRAGLGQHDPRTSDSHGAKVRTLAAAGNRDFTERVPGAIFCLPYAESAADTGDRSSGG